MEIIGAIIFILYVLLCFGISAALDCSVWLLILGIPASIITVIVIIAVVGNKIKKREIKNNTWQFPVDATRDYFSEHPTCSVDDGICHVLKKSGVPEQYHARYRNDAEIKRKVEEIRKYHFYIWQGVNAAK